MIFMSCMSISKTLVETSLQHSMIHAYLFDARVKEKKASTHADAGSCACAADP